MKIGIIGAGRVGTTFALYLKNHKCEITGFYSLPIESSEESANIINSEVYKNISEVVDKSDLVLICVNDDSIRDIVNQITELNYHNKIFCHTSGVHSIEILESLHKNESSIMSLHPLLSIPDKVSQVDMLSGAFIIIEFKGNTNVKNIIKDKFNNVIEFDGDKRLYHAAACITSNYLNTLLNIAHSTFKESGLNDDDTLKVMKPLIEGSINNFFQKGPDNSLTGPISRGDINTVNLHLNSLFDFKELSHFYSCMGNETTELAYRNKYINKEKQDKLLEVLNYGKNND